MVKPQHTKKGMLARLAESQKGERENAIPAQRKFGILSRAKKEQNIFCLSSRL
jgi:hypothetical protein